MKEHYVEIDEERYVRVGSLRSFLRGEVFVEFAENKKRPLALNVYLAADHVIEKPTIVIDLWEVWKKELDSGAKDFGYSGWPNVLAVRDSLKKLVRYMDKWDADAAASAMAARTREGPPT